MMSFAERQRQLLRTGEFSDFTLNVKGRHFKVHRSIVCPQSTVLHRICTGDFREALEGIGSLPEENPDVFEKVLEFVYTGDYDSGGSEIKPVQLDDNDAPGSGILKFNGDGGSACVRRQQSEELMIHTEVYLLAKYLNIGPLMEYAIEKFTAVVEKSFRADAFGEALTRVFNHGSDGGNGLRAQILRLCIEYSELLDEELVRLLVEHEPVAWKLLSLQGEEHARQIDATVKERQVLEETLGTLQGTIESLRQREMELTLDRDRMLVLLEKHDKCRNCDKEFGSYVDKHERGIVRCKICRCRHYLER